LLNYQWDMLFIICDIGNESFCTSKCSQILALKAGKGGSGNPLAQALKCWPLKAH